MILSIDISSNSSLQASSSFAASPLTTVGPNESRIGKKQPFLCVFLTISAIRRKQLYFLAWFHFPTPLGTRLNNQLECYKVNVFALINGKNLAYCTPAHRHPNPHPHPHFCLLLPNTVSRILLRIGSEGMPVELLRG